MRLLALLAATAAFAALVLLIKYQMEGVRARVEAMASERTGSNFTLGQVRVTGLRGVEVKDLKARFNSDDGASVSLDIPTALLYVDLIDLLSGQISIEQVRLDHASLEITRTPSGVWFTPEEAEAPEELLPTEAIGAESLAAEGEGSEATADSTESQPEVATVEPAAVVEGEPIVVAEELDAPATAELASEATDQLFPDRPKSSTAGIFGAIEAVLPNFPFRVVGEHCTINVQNVVGDTSIALSEVRLDAYRLSDSPDVSASISGMLDDDEAKRIELRARYASSKDFDIRISHDSITPRDVNVFLPADQHVFEQGEFRPQIRLSGFPSDTLVLSVEAPYTGLVFRGQPEFLPPLTGRLTAFAQYDLESRMLEITTAKAQSPEFSGDLSGSVSFASEEPQLDLELQASKLPVRDILNNFLAEQSGRFGVADLTLDAEHALMVGLSGTPSAPVISARAEMNSGELRLEPDNAALPRGTISLGRVDVAWDSATSSPRGCIVIQSGNLEHKAFNLRAEQLSGTLCIEGDTVTLEPFTALFTGNPLQGTVRYNTQSQSADFTVSGSVANMESTPLANIVKELSLGGSAGLRASGKAGLAGASVDLSIDLTQARVGFEWWLDKPPGVGAIFHGVHLEYKPKKAVNLTGNLTLDTAEFNAVADLAWQQQKFVLNKIRAKSSRIDIATADRLLRVPYRMSGGSILDASFDWDRATDHPDGNRFTLAGKLDEASILAKTTQVPLVARNADILASIVSLDDTRSKLTVTAEEATVPPFSERWLIPLDSEAPPEMVAQFKSKKQNYWTYEFKSAALNLGPWEGRNFEANAKDDASHFHMERFAAQVGEGTLSGDYRLRNEDNVGTLNAQWQKIPASYLLAHLEMPTVLSGPCTGEVAYTVDHDDPATLRGTGRFEVSDGQFSADYLVTQLQGALQGDASTLPPSLAFSRVGGDLAMEGDRITSQEIYLDSPGLRITGSGYYIADGDMNYDIQVFMTPETAARIPILQTYFNIEGHRLTQNELVLGFRISGPAFRPRSEVAGLPSIGITLVSGAFEMTSEALKIVDLPRQLLFDLFKIGGGIVGAQR